MATNRNPKFVAIMKSFFKILSVALLLCAFVASCSSDSTEPEPEPAPNPSVPVQGDEIVIPEDTDLSPTISQDGDSKTVRFTAKEPWQAYVADTRAASDWLHVSPTSGEAGEVELTITTERNEAPDDREGFVKIVSGNSQATISVTQKQRDALTVSPSQRTIDARETEFEVEVRANIDFEVEVRADWIEQISTRALTTTVLQFRAKRNIEDKRTATIIIRSGEKSETITITQEKGEFIVDTERINIDAAKQSVSARVRANIDFEVESKASWIHYNSTRAMTSYTLGFDIDENMTGKERAGEITVSSNGKSETITIIQSNEAFDVKFDKTEVSNEGEVITATVNSNMEYAIVLPDNIDWLTCVDTRAITTKTHNFKIEANPNFETRSAIIKFVYQSEKGEAVRQVTITQKSSNINVARTLYELGANGERLDIRVQGNTSSSSDIEYYITKGVEWISRIETRAVTAYFTFNIDKNTTGKLREGEIEFTLPDKANTKVRIVQSATDNTVYFPDENFKAYMVANFDKNKDSEISEYEASFITEIHCSNNNIESLEGIQHCTALTHLCCDNNQLTSLDVSECSALTELDCDSNPLEVLNLGDVNPPSYLLFDDSLLGSTKLKVISSKITKLDVSSNKLQSLDVSECPALTNLDCSSNQLTNLDVSKNTALTDFDCSSNQLTNLDVSKNTALTDFDCSSNQLTNLDVSKNTALTSLDCTDNPLEVLNLRDVNPSRYYYDSYSYKDYPYFYDGRLGSSTKLKVISTKITKLKISSNKLQSLDVRECPALTNLDCSSNQLTTLDVSNNTALTQLYCTDNPLEVLNLGDVNPSYYCYNYDSNTNSYLYKDFPYFYGGRLGSSPKLKVISTKITKLDVSSNKLQSLDVRECPALTNLDCSSNQLTSLDVTGTDIGYYHSGKSYTKQIVDPKYEDLYYDHPKGQPFPSDLLITVTCYYYPLDCSNIHTLQTLYLKASWWGIRGIDVERSTDYIPSQTEILYKD